MSRLVEHVLLRITRDPDGRRRTLLAEYASKAEASEEARRIVDEEDPTAELQVLPAVGWHNGEYLGDGT